jgi:hypothetical protein
MAQTFDSGKDLSREMHVLRAIRWGISASENSVTPATIQNCWARSQVIDFGSRPLPSPDLWAESRSQLDTIRQTLCRLKESGYLLMFQTYKNMCLLILREWRVATLIT